MVVPVNGTGAARGGELGIRADGSLNTSGGFYRGLDEYSMMTVDN